MSYREIRVRPVVRYIVTDYKNDDSGSSSVSLGEFSNAALANKVAETLAVAWQPPFKFVGEFGKSDMIPDGTRIVFEPARNLKIDWLRGPGEPREAIRWELIEVD